MDIRSIRYAVTLAEELHFGRAADRHFIASQPFGRRIKELERQLGTSLFARTSRKVEITPQGTRFLPRARRLLADLDDLAVSSFEAHSESLLRIGVLGFGLADHWPATRELLGRHCPELELSFVELDWQGQYDAVRAGEVDVAIVHHVGGADDLVVDEVEALDRYAVVPVESKFADASRLTFADVCEQPWIVPQGHRELTEWFGGESPKGAVAVRSPVSIPVAVATTGLLSVHGEPASRLLPHPGVKYIPVEGLPAVVGVAARVDDERAAVRSFRRLVQAASAVKELRDSVPATR